MTIKREWLVRLTAEFAVIFTSVLLALFADDWRQSRDRRADEQRTVALLRRDLAENIASLQAYLLELNDQEAAARAFFEGLEAGWPADTLETLVRLALSTWNYRPANVTYRGLVQTGQLSLIQNETVRDSVIYHYDETTTYLDDLRERVALRTDRAMQLVQRHLAVDLTTAPDSVPYNAHVVSPIQWKFVTSPAALKSDTEALSAMTYAAEARSWMRIRINQIFLPGDSALFKALGRYGTTGK